MSSRMGAGQFRKLVEFFESMVAAAGQWKDPGKSIRAEASWSVKHHLSVCIGRRCREQSAGWAAPSGIRGGPGQATAASSCPFRSCAIQVLRQRMDKVLAEIKKEICLQEKMHQGCAAKRYKACLQIPHSYRHRQTSSKLVMWPGHLYLRTAGRVPAENV